jgi:hypothetical protein
MPLVSLYDPPDAMGTRQVRRADVVEVTRAAGGHRRRGYGRAFGSVRLREYHRR